MKKPGDPGRSFDFFSLVVVKVKKEMSLTNNNMMFTTSLRSYKHEESEFASQDFNSLINQLDKESLFESNNMSAIAAEQDNHIDDEFSRESLEFDLKELDNNDSCISNDDILSSRNPFSHNNNGSFNNLEDQDDSNFLFPSQQRQQQQNQEYIQQLSIDDQMDLSRLDGISELELSELDDHLLHTSEHDIYRDEEPIKEGSGVIKQPLSSFRSLSQPTIGSGNMWDEDIQNDKQGPLESIPPVSPSMLETHNQEDEESQGEIVFHVENHDNDIGI